MGSVPSPATLRANQLQTLTQGLLRRAVPSLSGVIRMA